MRVGEGVEDVFARPPPGDDVLGAEQTKLLRDGGEPHACGFGELRDAPLAVAQAMQELEARDVALPRERSTPHARAGRH